MPLQTEEQLEKRPSLFVELEAKNILILKSNVYIISSHFIKSMNRTVACYGDKCKVDHDKIPPRKEYYYFGSVKDVEGVIRVPASVFFSLNDYETALGKDKRQFSWLVLKTGSGLGTEYRTSKDEAYKPDYDMAKNNSNLEQVMKKYELIIQTRYQELESGDDEEEV